MTAPDPTRSRPLRADAARNVGRLLETAKAVFAESGVDAPAKLIADRAGVGVGTLYRHFPQRSQLVAAVLQREIDALAAAARRASTRPDPVVALRKWITQYVDLIGTKQGLAAAMHSGDPAFDALPGYFRRSLEPVVQTLIAAGADRLRRDLSASDLLSAVVLLCQPIRDEPFTYNRRMVGIFVDGLQTTSGRPTRG